MSKGLRLLACACMLLLGGCALPLPVQIAKWGIDGLLLIATEKTTADHGMSLIVQRDCAMLRVVTEGSLCRDDAVTMIASADAVPPAVASDAAAYVDADAAERVAALATAAGGDQEPARPEAETLAMAAVETAPEPAEIAVATPEPAEIAVATPEPAEIAVATPEPAEIAVAALEQWAEQWTERWTERWQAILDAALFIDQLAQSAAPVEASRDVQWHIEGLYLGDASLDPYLDGTYAETVLGGAGDDSLAGTTNGQSGWDRNSPPITGDSRGRERGQARTRRARRLSGLRGRGPPGRRGYSPRKFRFSLIF